MKKAFLILLAVLICLTGTACRKNETSKSTASKATSAASASNSPGSTSASSTGPEYTTTFSSPVDPTPQPSDTDIFLYSKDGISLYFRSLANGTGTKDFCFFVRNSGNQLVTVKLTLMAVNRYAMSTTEEINLISQTAAVMTLSVWNSNLSSFGIMELSEITEIAVQITVEDSHYTTIFDQIVTYTIPQDD